jgi:hypothetical protein
VGWFYVHNKTSESRGGVSARELRQEIIYLQYLCWVHTGNSVDPH